MQQENSSYNHWWCDDATNNRVEFIVLILTGHSNQKLVWHGIILVDHYIILPGEKI